MKIELWAWTLVLGTAASALAAPSIRPDSVALTQPPSGGTVRVDYVLEDGPAIVTCDILTNGTSIGLANLRGLGGAVNRRVEAGAQTITWKPWRTWPNRDFDAVHATAVVTAWSPAMPPDYMVVDLASGDVRYYTCEEALPGGSVTNDLYKTDCMAFRKCPAGGVEWRNGTATNEYWGSSSDIPARLVALKDDFYIGVFPVTQGQYRKVTGQNGSFYDGADRDLHPVEQVDWRTLRGSKVWPADGHAVGNSGFFYLLRKLAGGGMFDLSTNAQWEFAARAGCGAELYDGNRLGNWQTSDNLKRLGAHRYGSTAPVGLFRPNDWGIYDMLANVEQFCLDYYLFDDRATDPETGALATDVGVKADYRVARGGCYIANAYECRVCSRKSEGAWGYRTIGFRVVCAVPDLPAK